MTDDTYSFVDTSVEHTVSKSKRPIFFGATKNIMDLVGASIAMVLLAPLLLAIAVCIKATSRGPVLFKQKRYGQNGKVFTTYKFRSMYVDLGDNSGVQQTVKNDPRITPVGRFLRRSNFDELPQIINVLKGEMSLVGPRPHVPGMLANGVLYEEFDNRYHLRHQVKPGITGLAQVNGFRGETIDPYAAHMRLEMDLEYIREQSPWLDIKIAVKTVGVEFLGGNGY